MDDAVVRHDVRVNPLGPHGLQQLHGLLHLTTLRARIDGAVERDDVLLRSRACRRAINAARSRGCSVPIPWLALPFGLSLTRGAFVTAARARALACAGGGS